MKKFGFVLIAVLFALTLVACDGFTPPEAAAEFDYDDLKPGEFYVTAGTGGNRALTSALARAGSDFFEVVLADEDAGKVFRTTFREGRNGRMEAPTPDENYNNGGDYKAYIFAGRYDDKTLLGVGILTHIDNGAGLIAGSTITTNTRAIQFTIQALTTDVNTANDDSSTFKPWEATAGIGSMDEEDMSKKIMVDGMPAPIFMLPHSRVIEDAPYNILTTTLAHRNAIMVAPEKIGTAPNDIDVDAPEVVPRGFIWSDGDYAPIEVEAVINNITQDATDATAITWPLLLDIDTNVTLNSVSVTSGLGRLSIEIPVVNYTAVDSDNQELPDLKAPVVWYLRGGLNNSIVDMGPTFNQGRGSMGGAILIGVGNVLAGAGGFIIGKLDPTP